MSSSNIKSWADASSDEESDSERIAPPPSNLPGSDSYAALQQAEEETYAEDFDAGGDAGGYGGKTLKDLPSNPPFTAYVGNLHRDLNTSKDFREELDRFLEDRGCSVQAKGGSAPVKVMGTRLITDRNTGQSKGFGYAEFATPEELLAFLNLGNHQLCGRNLKVDIASGEPRTGGDGGGGGGRGRGDQRRSGRSNRDGGGSGRYERQYSDNSATSFNRRDNRDDAQIDGSQFQGGRYARSNSNMSTGSAAGGSGSLRRNGSGMMKRSDSAASTGSGAGPNSPARQRPSLKLAPRTIPLEEGKESASRSSIFGDAMPRDETKFEEKKAGEAASNQKEENSAEQITKPMSDLEVVKESAGAGEGSSDANEKTDSGTKEEGKKSLDRKPSRGTSGRGEGRGRGEDRNNSDRKRDGKRDITARKPSGRGEGRGSGGRGDKSRNNERGGRGNTQSGKHSSASAAKSANGNAGKNDEVVVTGSAAVPPVKAESKAPPKKTNSFAAFMDESDDE